MEATLTELHRETARIIRPVIHGGKEVILTEHGEAQAKIVSLRKADRRGLLKLIRSMGHIDLPARK